MTFTDAAREVLRQSGRPLHYKEITELAIEKNLLSHVGKSPEVTMGARLAATLKKGGDDNPLVRVKPGVFALREWDDETIKRGLEIKHGAGDSEPADDDGLGVNGAGLTEGADEEPPTPQAARPAPLRTARIEPQMIFDEAPPAPDEEMRAEIAAGAREVFGEEEDDDQPILRTLAEDDGRGDDGRGDDERGDDGRGDDGAMEGGDGRRRRRRRRRRGSPRGNEQGRGMDMDGGGGMPSFTTTPLDGDGAPRGPQVIELSQAAVPLDTLAGRGLADAIAAILASFDRTVGAVSLRQIVETAQRRGRLSGDTQLGQSQIAAAVRADNARRSARGLRPRFRMVGGRVGLTDWLLDGELGRLEREALVAIERFREAARRSFAKKCAELPGHAFVELAVTLMERLGVAGLRPLKFPGASGAEAHFAGTLHTPAGNLPGAITTGDGLKLAIVVRRDGRDLGRERVTELRGSAHHYDGAAMGWLFTAGQMLSGAREEAGAHGVMPVAMLDGPAIARLCEEHDVAVVRAANPVAVADVDFFEALRAS